MCLLVLQVVGLNTYPYAPVQTIVRTVLNSSLRKTFPLTLTTNPAGSVSPPGERRLFGEDLNSTVSYFGLNFNKLKAKCGFFRLWKFFDSPVTGLIYYLDWL